MNRYRSGVSMRRLAIFSCLLLGAMPTGILARLCRSSVLLLALALPSFGQGDQTLTFNVNKTLDGRPDTGFPGETYSTNVTKSAGSVTISLTRTIPNAPSFGGTAVVTFAAPTAPVTGTEFPRYLSGGPALVLDNPATFQISATFSNSDDTLGFVLTGFNKSAGRVSCDTTLTPKKPTATCVLQAFLISTPATRGVGETGDFPRLLEQSFVAFYGTHGGNGPTARVIVEYDYDNGCGGSANPPSSAKRSAGELPPGCGNKIALGPVFPVAETLVFIPAAGAKDVPVRSPVFIGPVNYQLQTKDKGEIGLELRTEDTSDGKPGKLIAISSSTIKVNKGSGQAGYQPPLLTIAPFAFNSITFGSSTLDDSNTKELLLRAVMTDPNDKGAILASSKPVRYPAAASKVIFELTNAQPGPEFIPLDPSAVTLNAGQKLLFTSSGDLLAAAIGYQLPPDAQAKLSFRITETAVDGRQSTKDYPIQLPAPVSGKGATFSLFPKDEAKEDTVDVGIRIAMTLLETGQTILSPSIILFTNVVFVATPTPPEDSLLVNGSTPKFTLALVVVVRDRGLRLVRNSRMGLDPQDNTTVIRENLAPGRYSILDDFSLPISQDAYSVGFDYKLEQSKDSFGKAFSRSIVYRNLKTILQLAADKTVDAVIFANGNFQNVKSKVNQKLEIASTIATLLSNPQALKLACDGASAANLFGKVNKNLLPYLKLLCPPGTFVSAEHESAFHDFRSANEAPDLRTIYSWAFDPPIPADGSFSGDVVFNYSAALLPDDPGFNESKLQLIAFDNKTSSVTVIPASFDGVNKTATARLNQLAPLYALAAVGPFTNSSLIFPDTTASSALSLVNFGSSSVAATLRGFSIAGEAIGTAPPNVAIPPGQQYLKAWRDQFAADARSPAAPTVGWVRTDVGSTQLVGAQTITDGTYFDVLPALARASIGPWVVTTVEQSDATSTRLLLTNPGTQIATYNVTVAGADGADKGTFSGTLSPKQQSIQDFTAMFPSITPDFQGYAIVGSDQPITVAEELSGSKTLAALSAQIPSADQASTLYAPRLGASSGVTMLTLVNSATSKARVVVKGFGPNGSPVGTPASITIDPGKQYRASLSSALGIADTQTGTLSATSDQPGLVGHLDLMDSIGNAFRATLPLDAAPAKSMAIPYVAQNTNSGTSLSISNTGSSSANVTIKAFASNGTAMGSRNVTLAANAQAADTLAGLIPAAASLANGFVTITSDQPVTAAALLSAKAELGLLPAEPVTISAAGGSGGPPPQITGGGVVNAASFSNKLVRGGLGSIFGSNFTTTTASAPSIPWQTTLGGVSVFIGGVAAPLYFVSPGQINFQVPFEVPAGNSSTMFVIAGGIASPSVPVVLGDYGVGVFTYTRVAGSLDPIIVHASDNTIVTPANPAVPNESLVAYATGIGKLTNPPRSGAGAPVSPLASAVDVPSVTLAGAPVSVLFAGLTPGFVGLVQLNLQLPANLPSGSLPLAITSPGDVSPTVNLAVRGNLASAPAIGVSTSSLAFASVTVGQNKDLTLLVSNTGSAALTVSGLNVTGTNFRVVSPNVPFNVAAGASQTVTVRFTPTSTGAASGTLTIASNDPARASFPVALSGTGVAAAAPAIDVSPASLDFGTVTVGQNKDLMLTVRNTGNATLNVLSIASTNARFGVSGGSIASVAAGASQAVTIRFTPTAAGAQAGTLTVNSNDPSRPTVSLNLTGTGSAPAAQSVTFGVDDGSYEADIGFGAGGANAWFVNRLTPPSYPATLRAVQIYFPSGELPLGTTIAVVVASNPSGVGGNTIRGLTFQLSNAQIILLDRLTQYQIPPVTIQSGDFVVGFMVLNPANIFPMATDITPPSRQRSYVSTDGANFTLIDSTGAGPGNFAIRAVADIGGASVVPEEVATTNNGPASQIPETIESRIPLGVSARRRN